MSRSIRCLHPSSLLQRAPRSIDQWPPEPLSTSVIDSDSDIGTACSSCATDFLGLPQAQAQVSHSTRTQTHRHCRGPCGHIQAQNVPPKSAVRKPPPRRRLFSILKIASTAQGRRGLLGGLVGHSLPESQPPAPVPAQLPSCPASEIPASRFPSTVLCRYSTVLILTIAGVLASRKCQQFSNVCC